MVGVGKTRLAIYADGLYADVAKKDKVFPFFAMGFWCRKTKSLARFFSLKASHEDAPPLVTLSKRASSPKNFCHPWNQAQTSFLTVLNRRKHPSPKNLLQENLFTRKNCSQEKTPCQGWDRRGRFRYRLSQVDSRPAGSGHGRNARGDLIQSKNLFSRSEPSSAFFLEPRLPSTQVKPFGKPIRPSIKRKGIFKKSIFYREKREKGKNIGESRKDRDPNVLYGDTGGNAFFEHGVSPLFF